jgi:Tfp pilus assembly protein PilV
VEVLVAILVLTTGALATVGTQLALARLSADTVTRERDAATAATIIDSLRASPCASLASGTRLTSGATFTWSVTSLGDLRDVRVHVVPSQGTPWAATTLLPCA